jgi:hypothetical protein
MRYKVPRDINYKAKIVGPATFSQLLYVGAAGLIIILLYLVFGKSLFFYILAIFIGTGGIALAFLRVAGIPLPEYLQKMFFFSFSSKEYLWEKKIIPMETVINTRKRVVTEEKEEEKKQSLRTGKMENIANKIETF